MIAAQRVRADERGTQLRAQRGTDEKVIDAPADIARAHTGHRTPPRVMATAFLELTKRIYESGAHDGIKPGAFLGREAVVPRVGFWVRQIQFGVRHVQVTTENHRLSAFEHFKVVKEIAVPLLAICEAAKVAL